MNSRDVFDRPIAFQRSFVYLTNSVAAALMLSQAVYWSRRCVDGWFYKTQAEWEEETGLSRTEQENARRILRSRGFIEERKKGIPCKVYYRVLMGNILEKYGLIPQSSLQVSRILDRGKAANSDAGKPQTITETTAETTHKDSRAHDETVRRVFDYYVETIGKSHLYTLTSHRLKKGRARLQNCLTKTRGDLVKAEELMKICIDTMAGSKFHMGENDSHQMYNDWENQLFSSEERMEKWLEKAAQRG